MPSHYTDRSRFITGLQECPTKRYWTYHAGGTGYSSGLKAVELWTGGLTHKMLEKVLLATQMIDKIPSREILRKSIQLAKEEFQKESKPNCSEFTLEEQRWLAECLVWGFIKTQLQPLLDSYQIISIEQEMPLQLENDIVLMVRPDLVLRRRQEGSLVLLDWKTAASFGDADIQEYQHSPQMAAGTIAAEKHIGEPVKEYMIFALIKGSRKVFTKGKGAKAICSPEKRQYSSLCYAKISPAAPPMTLSPSYDLTGFWLDKSPLWLELKNPEVWIDMLEPADLMDSYLLVGPYPRQDFMIGQFFASLQVEELKWKALIEQISAGAKPEALIPKSFKCHQYGGSICGFYDLCFKVGDAWKEPLEHGFEPRQPHHETEKIEERSK